MMKSFFRHFLLITFLLLLSLGLPGYYHGTWKAIFSKDPDAVSGASREAPAAPSGDFYVLIRKDLHKDTLPDWESFFMEKPVGGIMEDISCLVPASDAAGKELAERYRLRLAENQMKEKAVEGTLLVSRAGHSLFDTIIISKEMAEAYDYALVFERPDIEVLAVSGALE